MSDLATPEPRVTSSQTERVRILSLNRPEARNALDTTTREALMAALKEAEADDGVGAIVLTGAGSCFAAGADIGELLARSGEEQKGFLEPPNIYSVIEALRKPVIAAMNGHALGAGLELATACDLRVAKTGVKLGQPEINLHLIPGGGGTQRLVRLVGKGWASRIVLIGEPIESEQAHGIGLVDHLVAEGDCMPIAIELARRMAKHHPDALAEAKAALYAATAMPYQAGLSAEIQGFLRRHQSPEARAAMQAFLDQ